MLHYCALMTFYHPRQSYHLPSLINAMTCAGGQIYHSVTALPKLSQRTIATLELHYPIESVLYHWLRCMLWITIAHLIMTFIHCYSPHIISQNWVFPLSCLCVCLILMSVFFKLLCLFNHLFATGAMVQYKDRIRKGVSTGDMVELGHVLFCFSAW